MPPRCVGDAGWRCRAVRPIRWLLVYPVHPDPLQFARLSLIGAEIATVPAAAALELRHDVAPQARRRHSCRLCGQLRQLQPRRRACSSRLRCSSPSEAQPGICGWRRSRLMPRRRSSVSRSRSEAAGKSTILRPSDGAPNSWWWLSHRRASPARGRCGSQEPGPTAQVGHSEEQGFRQGRPAGRRPGDPAPGHRRSTSLASPSRAATTPVTARGRL